MWKIIVNPRFDRVNIVVVGKVSSQDSVLQSKEAILMEQQTLTLAPDVAKEEEFYICLHEGRTGSHH